MPWKQLERHQLSAQYDDLTGTEWDTFLAGFDVGFLADHPIVMHEGKILDGWQRQRACVERGIEPVYTSLPESMDAEAFVRAVNDNRRHETPERRARRVAERRERVAKMRDEGASLRVIAKAENVDEKTIRKDLQENPGADGSAPDATPQKTKENGKKKAMCVTGFDGKEYPKTTQKPRCERCARKGLDGNNCDACKELRKKPKQDDGFPKTLHKDAKKAFKNDKIKATPEQIATFAEFDEDTQAGLIASILAKRQTLDSAIETGEIAPPTVDEEIDEVNGKIESFCRRLMAFVKEECPDDVWLKHNGRKAGAIQKFTDGCEQLRTTKCYKPCPVCDGNRCEKCLNSGRVPKVTYDQLAR